MPSFTIICILSLFIDQFLANEIVQYAFRGIRAVVGVLILNAAIKLIKNTPKNLVSLIVFLLAISLTFIFPNVSTIYFIILGFIFGVVWYAIINKPKEGGNK